MPVTDDQVAALRARLSGHVEEYRRRWADLDTGPARSGYDALVTGGFVEAVDRWFAAEGTVAEVIEFVGSVQARSEGLGEELDPRVAERLIRHSRGEGSIADIDLEKRSTAQGVILAALTADDQLDDEGLDEFLEKARVLGDRLMS